MKVYLLEHHRVDGTDSDYKTIGIFASEDSAKEAILVLEGKPGFKDCPKDFNIDEYELDKVFWVDGFG